MHVLRLIWYFLFNPFRINCFLADCSDLLKLNQTLTTGVYEVSPWNNSTKTQVYCDMDTEGGGWTVCCLSL